MFNQHQENKNRVQFHSGKAWTGQGNAGQSSILSLYVWTHLIVRSWLTRLPWGKKVFLDHKLLFTETMMKKENSGSCIWIYLHIYIPKYTVKQNWGIFYSHSQRYKQNCAIPKLKSLEWKVVEMEAVKDFPSFRPNKVLKKTKVQGNSSKQNKECNYSELNQLEVENCTR